MRNQKYRIEARIKELGLEIPELRLAIPALLSGARMSQVCTDTAYIDSNNLNVTAVEVSREGEGEGSVDYPSLSNATNTSVPSKTVISQHITCSEYMESSHIRQSKENGTDEISPSVSPHTSHNPPTPSSTSSSSSSSERDINRHSIYTQTQTNTNTCIDTPMTTMPPTPVTPKTSLPDGTQKGKPNSPFIPNLITLPPDQNVPSNPKTRLGWGFWQT